VRWKPIFWNEILVVALAFSSKFLRNTDMPATQRKRLPNRRLNQTFSFIAADGLRYTATAAWFDDGRLGELFLGNHKSNSAADTNARDAAIVLSIALQFGADVETIRRALCRDGHGRASGVLGVALDRLADAKS
jgi:hypothetical protein